MALLLARYKQHILMHKNGVIDDFRSVVIDSKGQNYGTLLSSGFRTNHRSGCRNIAFVRIIAPVAGISLSHASSLRLQKTIILCFTETGEEPKLCTTKRR